MNALKSITLPKIGGTGGSKLNVIDIPDLNIKIDNVGVPKNIFDNLKINFSKIQTQAGAKNALEGIPSLTKEQYDTLMRTRTNIPFASADDAAKAGGKTADNATRNSPDYDPANVKAGSKWSPMKLAAGGLVAAAAVVVTGKMLSKAKQGADNDGKEYTITSLTNNASTGNVILCKFKPSIEPSGIVINDTVTFKDTGTFLDGNMYTITEKRSSHFECMFEAEQRLTAEVKNKGTFILGTSFENHMDDQTTLPNPLAFLGGLGEKLQELFGNLAVRVTIGSGIISCIICLVLMITLISKISG